MEIHLRLYIETLLETRYLWKSDENVNLLQSGSCTSPPKKKTKQELNAPSVFWEAVLLFNSPSQEGNLIFQPSIFRGHVCFREGNCDLNKWMEFELTWAKPAGPPLFLLLTQLGLHRPQGWVGLKLKFLGDVCDACLYWKRKGKVDKNGWKKRLNTGSNGWVLVKPLLDQNNNIHKIHDTNLMWRKVPF